MTLGWFWCFEWYHTSQRAAGSGPLGLLDTFDPGKFLPSLWPHLLLCCLYLFLPSSWDCQAGPRVVNPFDLYVWPWKIHRSPFFLRVEFKESRGGGEGFSEFLTLVPVSFLDTLCLTIVCWHTSPVLLVFYLACFFPALVTRTTLGTSRVSFIIITNKNFFCLILKTSLINFAYDTCYFFSLSFIFFLVAHWETKNT